MSKTKQRPTFKGFSYDDGRIVPVAYLDGYNFGDRLLEGVSFKITVQDDGTLAAAFADPDNEHVRSLNQAKWLKEAIVFAEEYDLFAEQPSLTGEDLYLEKA